MSTFQKAYLYSVICAWMLSEDTSTISTLPHLAVDGSGEGCPHPQSDQHALLDALMDKDYGHHGYTEHSSSQDVAMPGKLVSGLHKADQFSGKMQKQMQSILYGKDFICTHSFSVRVVS